MKKLLILFVLISGFAFGQTEIDTIINNRKETRVKIFQIAKELGGNDYVFSDFDNVVSVFEKVKKELLSIQDLNNKQLQKIVVEPLTEHRYFDYFTQTSDGKSETMIKYGFTDRDLLIRQIKLMEAVMLGNIIDKELAIIKKRLNERDLFIQNNLKRLGITIKQWDDMTESDRKILVKKFQ